MKHLKSFLLLEWDLPIYEPQYSPLPEDIKLDIQDICLELKDYEYKVYIGEFDIRGGFECTNYITIKTPDDGNIEFHRTFAYNEIEEVVERIKDYLKTKGYTTYVRLNRTIDPYKYSDHLLFAGKSFSDCRIFIKPLEQDINEMENWATSNRLGGNYHNDKIDEFVELYNDLCDTDSPYGDDIYSSYKFRDKTIDILKKLNFSKEECLKLLELKLRHRGIIRLAVRNYKYKGGPIYYNESISYLVPSIFRKKKKPDESRLISQTDNLDIPDFINNVYDIFLELKDEGFSIKTDVEKQKSVDELKKIRQEKGHFLGVGIHRGIDYPSFRLSEVSETILRLFDYSKSQDVEISISIFNADGTQSHRDKEGFNNLVLSNLVRFVRVKFY